MKIGVSAFAWTTDLRRSHLDLLGKIREHGFDGFEIPMFDPASLAVRDIRKAFEAADLKCTVCAVLPARHQSHQPGLFCKRKVLRTSGSLRSKMLGAWISPDWGSALCANWVSSWTTPDRGRMELGR